MNARTAFLALFALMPLACDDDDAESLVDASSDATQRLDGGADSALPDEGVLPEDSALSDASESDAAVRFTTCEAACAQYEACGRLEELYGSTAACEAACAASSREGPPENWFICVSGESCNLLHLCRLPEAPPPTCDQACTALTACEVALPFDCATTCEAEGAEAFGGCADALGGEACQEDAFFDCLLVGPFEACADRCQRTVGCNLERAADCEADCLADVTQADGLAQLRAAQQNECVQRTSAEDCVRMDQCLLSGGQPVDQQTFCASFSSCGLDEMIGTCEDFFTSQPAEQSECFYDALMSGCPRDPWELMNRCQQDSGPSCVDLCLVNDACGKLPGGQSQLQCINDCNMALNGENAAVAAQTRLELACAEANDCESFNTCLDQANPDVSCTPYCEALAGCAQADLDECLIDCRGGFYLERVVAHQRCVRDADASCEQMAGCTLGEPIGCDQICERTVACQEQVGQPITQAACVTDCDNRQFREPGLGAQMLSCTLQAADCWDLPWAQPGVLGCLDNALAASTACVGYCRVEAVDGRDLEICISICAKGFNEQLGDEAASFLEARPCLESTGLDASIEALSVCLVPGEPDCSAICAALDACGVATADCVEACQGDALGRLTALQVQGCLGAASNCTETRACAGTVDAPQVDISQENFCRLFNECGLDRDWRCEDAFNELNSQAGDSGLVCAVEMITSGCPGAIFEVYDRCMWNRPRPELAACVELCEAAGVCQIQSLVAERGMTGCINQCKRDYFDSSQETARWDTLMPCAYSPDCGYLDACLVTNSPEGRCAEFCDVQVACKPDLDAEACNAACLEDFSSATQVRHRECVTGAQGCQAVADCAPRPGPMCDLACDRLVACNLLADDAESCEPGCDESFFMMPEETLTRVACIVTATACMADPGVPPAGHVITDCLAEDLTMDSSCYTYCRALSECGAGEDAQACVDACAAGFEPEQAVAFAAAKSCLQGVGPTASCNEMLACLAVSDGCPAYCGGLERCGLAPEGCLEACSATSLEVQACVFESSRMGYGCEGTASCVGFEEPARGPACADWCARQGECGLEDAFSCRLSCAPEDTTANRVQAACAQVALCGALEVCGGLTGELNAACVELCQDAVACGAFPSVEGCVEICTGKLASPNVPADTLATLTACVADTTGPGCDSADAHACFESIRAADCVTACEALSFCFPYDECVSVCQETLRVEPERGEAGIACVLERIAIGCDPDILWQCFRGQ